MYGTGYHNFKQIKPVSKRKQLHISSHLQKIDTKTNVYIKINIIQIYIYIYMHNTFPIVGLFEGIWERRERKGE
jgi:hypothetical protein